MKLWCFDDAHDWGKSLQAAATKRGIEAHLFDDPRSPTKGFVFVHMHHHSSVRLLHKRIMTILAVNPDLILLPDYRASVLFDDKVEQAIQFSKWTPRTRIFYSPGGAKRFLENGVVFPFVSKAAEGTHSHNVRIVADMDAAKQEVRHAFSDIGIKCRQGLQQRSYLLWQDYIPGGESDIRVAAIGSKRLLLRRQNKSPTNYLTPVTDLTDLVDASALEFANAFFKLHGIYWGAVDLIRGQDGWLVLETTVSWPMHRFYECNFIDGTTVLDRKGDQVWEVTIDEMLAGNFL